MSLSNTFKMNKLTTEEEFVVATLKNLISRIQSGEINLGELTTEYERSIYADELGILGTCRTGGVTLTIKYFDDNIRNW